jgi:hypothetical protein
MPRTPHPTTVDGRFVWPPARQLRDLATLGDQVRRVIALPLEMPGDQIPNAPELSPDLKDAIAALTKAGDEVSAQARRQLDALAFLEGGN